MSVGDKLAQIIHPSDQQSPTAHIKIATVEFKFNSVSDLQVMKMIKNFVNSKATGIFGIPDRAFKDCAEHIVPSLSDIFNFLPQTKVFPYDLTVGKVAPLYKSGDKDDLNNCRPISVLPTVARVFEKILYGQVYEHFTSKKLLGNLQFGFRTLHSTALARVR